MADEIRVDSTREPDHPVARHEHPAEIREHADVEGTVPVTGAESAIVPDDPDAAREAIRHTRDRMSETLDQIEGQLVRKRERIQERLDVMAPVRQNPLPAVGAALGVGVLLGALTGGDDEGDHHYDARVDAEERADLWEARARRLLRIAQEQEDELDDTRQQLLGRGPARHDEWDGLEDHLDDEHGDLLHEDEDFEPLDEYDAAPSALDRVRDAAVDRLADAVYHGVQQLFNPAR